MLFLILPFFSYMIDNGIPRFTLLQISEDNAAYYNDFYTEHWDDLIKAIKVSCDSLSTVIERETCLMTADSLDSVKFSDGQDLPDVLSKIPKTSKFLFFIDSYSRSHRVNFNNLPKQFSVFMVPEYSGNNMNIQKFIKKMAKSSFDGSQKSIMELSNHFSQKKNDKKISKRYYNIILKGDIKKKVSFLTIVDYIIELDDDLNCHSLFLSDVVVRRSSYVIKTDFLIVDQRSYYDIDFSTSTIDVKEFGLYISTGKYYKYQIIYTSNYVQIDEKPINDSFDGYYWSVPNEIFSSFSLIVSTAINFDIHVYETNIIKFPNLNITILDKPMLDSSPISLDNTKETVKVSSSGNWQPYYNKPIVTLTMNTTRYNIDTRGSLLHADVKFLYVFDMANNYYLNFKSRSKSLYAVGIITALVLIGVISVALIIAMTVYSYKSKIKIVG